MGLDQLRSRASAYLDAVFGIDVRGAAVLRIGLGVLLLIDIADRSRDIVAHYSDLGAMPRSMVPGIEGRLSFHMMSGEPWWEALLFAITALAALALAVGYRTKTALAVSWVLNFSLQSRNPLVLYGGDIVLRVVLFWALFLPLGEVWSVDAKLRGGPPRGSRACHAGTIGYLAQIAFIYLTTVALKTGNDWQNGTAVYYALQIDFFTEPFGKLLLPHIKLTAALTWAVYWFEMLGPLMLLVPSWRLRTAVVLGFVSMHLSFEMFMEIGLFPWTSALTWLPLLPKEAWDRLRLPRVEGPILRSEGAARGLAIAALIYVTWWNMGSVYPKTWGVTGSLRAPARLLRLDQYWDMFAPEPFKDDGWYIIVGTRADGQTTDALHGGPVVWAKPANVPHWYKNERWRKYLRNIWETKYRTLRKPYLKWLCRDWNAHAASQARLTTVTLNYMREDSPPPGQTTSARKIQLETTPCPAAEPPETKPPG